MAEFLEPRRLLAASGRLYASDFNGTTLPSVNVAATGGTAQASVVAIGTVDLVSTATKSNAFRLNAARPNGTGGAYSASLQFAPMSFGGRNNVDSKLYTLSFDLASSTGAPVQVLISSHDTATGSATGTLKQVIYPAAAANTLDLTKPNSLQRYTVDTATAKNDASVGTFDGKAAYISFTFVIDSANLAWPTDTTSTTADQSVGIVIDNLNYSKPSYYVNPANNAGAGGETTESPSYATIQAAVDAASAANDGGIIAIRGAAGPSYQYADTNSSQSMVQILKGGTNSNWLSLKAYPGDSVQLSLKTSSDDYNAISVGIQNQNGDPDLAAAGYVEIRGLQIWGNNRDNLTSYPDSSAPRNTNGISVDGFYANNRPHDIRIADNLVQYCSGLGITARDADRVMIEGNTAKTNCRYSAYEGSGISLLSMYNFEAYSAPTAANPFNPYSRIVRNNIAFGNEISDGPEEPTDGNGIIIDVNRGSYAGRTGKALGRTLVQNNLSYLNGGSGIHVFKADNVDVFNNTTYLNCKNAAPKHGQIDVSNYDSFGVDSVRIYNNIMIAPDNGDSVRGSTDVTTSPPVNGNPDTTNYLPFYKNNFYYGGDSALPGFNKGTDETVLTAAQFYTAGTTTPLFRGVTTNNVATAMGSIPSLNFNLATGSLAINQANGVYTQYTPYSDGLGRVRTPNRDIGAYEYQYYT